jgi:hypothetical protein
MSLRQLAALSLLFLTAAPVLADDERGVSPYRPSVSNPAQLPVPGQLELELGGLHVKSEGARRDSLPYLLKLGFSDQWGVLLGGEAYVAAYDDTSGRVRGIGDTTLVLKRAFLIDEATAYGLELSAKLPTAKDSVRSSGSGKTDYTLNGIYSKDLGKLHADANLNFTRLGEAEAGASRTQTGWSGSFSMPVGEQWGATAELSGSYQRGAPNTAQVLAALTYSPSKWVSFDVGVVRGLTGASPDWAAFAGVVVPVARLW